MAIEKVIQTEFDFVKQVDRELARREFKEYARAELRVQLYVLPLLITFSVSYYILGKYLF